MHKLYSCIFQSLIPTREDILCCCSSKEKSIVFLELQKTRKVCEWTRKGLCQDVICQTIGLQNKVGRETMEVVKLYRITPALALTTAVTWRNSKISPKAKPTPDNAELTSCVAKRIAILGQLPYTIYDKPFCSWKTREERTSVGRILLDAALVKVHNMLFWKTFNKNLNTFFRENFPYFGIWYSSTSWSFCEIFLCGFLLLNMCVLDCTLWERERGKLVLNNRFRQESSMLS